MSGFHLGKVPFKKVLIHGLVRAKDGRKFSKSLGNGIEPLEIADKYGADALRIGLIAGSAIGSDIKFDEDKIKGYKNFANKLWNIARFVIGATGVDPIQKPETLSEKDTAIYQEAELVFEDVTKEIEDYHFHLAAEKLYHYIWHNFADILIEESKPILSSNDQTLTHSRKWLLQTLLTRSLIALHPFAPFVTEELWSITPHEETHLLIATSWNFSATLKP